MRNSFILVGVSKVLLPVLLLFGFYVVFYGDAYPGGGFQGGAIIATTFILTAFIQRKKSYDISHLVKLEKICFLLLLLISCASFITRGVLITNFMPKSSPVDTKRIFLLILNLLIGIKVSAGLITIISAFMEEGE